MTTDDLAARTYQPFSQAFFDALLKGISEASGSPWLAAAVPDAQPSADEAELVRINLVLAGDLQGEFMLEFRRAAALTKNNPERVMLLRRADDCDAQRH